MRYANLGASPLKVSRLCFGAMSFGDTTQQEQAARLVNRALDLGVHSAWRTDYDLLLKAR